MFWLTDHGVDLIVCLWPSYRCRKLPRALKDWQAFQDLKQTIDDFNESCPLLELMANKAMKQRHWDRIAGLTGHTFDMESETFSLRNIMEAPLLKHKEDIEVFCCFVYCQSYSYVIFSLMMMWQKRNTKQIYFLLCRMCASQQSKRKTLKPNWRRSLPIGARENWRLRTSRTVENFCCEVTTRPRLWR